MQHYQPLFQEGNCQSSLSLLQCESVKTAFKLNVIHFKCLEMLDIQLIQSVWFTLIHSVATSRLDSIFCFILIGFQYSPRPCSRAVRDLRIGPNCLGSPASTSKPPLGWLGSRRSATGMMHSGSVACPASSMKMWLKWLRGNFAETNLGRDKGWRQALWQHTWEMMVEVVGGWGVLWRLGWEDIGLFCFHWQIFILIHVKKTRHNVSTYLPAVTRVVTIIR